MTKKSVVPSFPVYQAAFLCLLVAVFTREMLAWDPTQTTSSEQEPIRVIRGLKLVHSVSPEYPKKARKQNIQGVVRMEIVIDRKGKVTEVKVLSGDPLLAEAAVKATKKCLFKPWLVDGQPVKVVTHFESNFSIQTSQPGPGHEIPGAITVVVPNTGNKQDH